MSQTAIYDASLVTRILRSRTLYAYYVLNSEFNNRTGGVRSEQQIPVSELVVLQRRLGEMIEFRNNKVLIPFEFDPAFGPGEQPLPPPLTSTFTLTFQASPLLPFPPPAVHNGMDAYFYYTGALQTVDWGDGTVEEVGETTPVSFAYKNHTYAAGGTYTITVVAQDLIGLWLFNLIHPPGPTLPSPADNSQPGMKGVDLTAAPQLEDFDCQYTGVTALTGLGASTMLDTLRCTGCAGLTALPTIAWPALTVLECGGTGVSALDLTASVALQALVIDGAPVTSVELSACAATINSVSAAGCTALTTLTNSGIGGLPALVAVNVSGCSSLGVLALPDAAALSILNITGAAALTVLFLGGSASLTGTLDLTGRGSLAILNLTGTGLTGVTLTGCAAVSNLVVTGSSLTSLNVTPCTALVTLLGSGCPALTGVTGLSNKTALTGVNMSNCPALLGVGSIIACPSLTSITLTGCTALTSLIILASPNLNAAIINGCSSLATITISGAKLTSQSFTGCTSLTTVGITNCTLLTTFNAIPNTGLLNITLSGCTSLTTTLDVTVYTGIKSIIISNSGITGIIGLPAKTALTKLSVDGCAGFTGMNVAGCSALKNVDALGTAGFDQMDVDAVLAQTASNSFSIAGGSVDLRVGGGIEPSLSGWTSYNTLIANGWTAFVNGFPPTPSASISFTLTLASSQAIYFLYDSGPVVIQWGDFTSSGSSGGIGTLATHTYTSAGTYTCTIIAYAPTFITGLYLYDASQYNQPYITAIDLNNATNLGTAVFDNTGIASIDLTGVALSLTTLSMSGTPLTALDLSLVTALQSITVLNCISLPSLSLATNTALMGAYISGSAIGTLDFSMCPSVQGIDAIGCPNLISITGLVNNTSLIMINIYNSPKLADVDVSGCTMLDQINANGCNLDQSSVDTMILQGSANKMPFGTPGTIDVAGGTNSTPSLSDATIFGAIANLNTPPGAWTVLYNSTGNTILAYSYWNSLASGTPTVYGTSDSGSSWTATALGLPFDSNTSSIQLFSYGGGRLLAVSEAVAPLTSSAVAVSTDRGSTWTLSQPNPSYGLGAGGGLDWNGATFLIGMANLAVTVNPFYTSADGLTWQPAAAISGTAADLFVESFDVAAEYGENPGRWAIAGKPDGGSNDVYISQSADATAAAWQPQNVFAGLRQLILLSSCKAVGVTRWVACGINVSVPGSLFYYGDDSAGNGTGITWNATPGGSLPGVIIEDITYNGSYFVAVGSGGTLATSTDGTSWTTTVVSDLSGSVLSSVVYDSVAGYWLIGILTYNASGQVYQIPYANPNNPGTIIAQPSYSSGALMRDLVILA